MEKLIESFNDYNTDIDKEIEICEEIIELLSSNIQLNESSNNLIKAISKFITKREELLEKRVAYKRKYTEKYPAKIIYSGAKIRKTIFNALKDDKITEEELNKILSEIGVKSNWKKNNAHLFKLLEEDGIKYYTLSKIGKKIKVKLPEIL
jgi:uncharacterized protein (UPF0305 family)